MKIAKNQEMIKNFHKTFGGSSNNFTITMAISQGHGTAYETYYRYDEPCYGELRKYKSTHGNAATQSERKPTDLFSPFPFYGTPCQVTASFNSAKENLKECTEFITYAVTKSPYSKGFDSTTVEVIDNTIIIYWLDANFDPTLAVNLLKNLQNLVTWGGGFKRWKEYVEGGMSEDDAFFTCLFLSSISGRNSIGSVSSYISTQTPSYKNFISGEYNKTLSNGLFVDGKDYNRKNLHDIWKNPEESKKTPLVTFIRSNITDKYDSLKFEEKCSVLVGLYNKYDSEALQSKKETASTTKKVVKAIELA